MDSLSQIHVYVYEYEKSSDYASLLYNYLAP